MKNNNRGLEDIAADIHDLHRAKLFEIGDLLIEAKAKCEHGGWLDWLEAQFDWSPDTAANYMKAAELSLKFRKIRNLSVPATVVYYLDGEDDEVISDAIAKLEAAARQGRVTAEQGREIIDLARTRNEYGDLPEETLKAIERTKYSIDAEKIVAALKKAQPVTKADAEAVIASVRRQCADEGEADDDDAEAEAETEAEAEAEALLDGPPPPELPAIQPASPEAQKFGTEESRSAWVEDFDSAVGELTRLKTRSVKEFTSTQFNAEDLMAAAEFIKHVAGRESDKPEDYNKGERIHKLEHDNLALVSEVEELKALIAEKAQPPSTQQPDLPCEHSLVPADDTSSSPSPVAGIRRACRGRRHQRGSRHVACANPARCRATWRLWPGIQGGHGSSR